MSIRHNLAMKKRQESLADIDSEIDKLRTDMYNNTQLKYSCSLDQLIQQVRQFGEIIDESKTNSNYCRKLTAIKVIDGLEGNSAIKNTVIAYNANDFQFVHEFEQTLHNPRLVNAGKEFIFVLSNINNLYQDKSSDFSFVAKMESWFFQIFTDHIGIAVSEDNQVIIMDSYGSIKLYDRALALRGKIQLDLKRFSQLW